MLDETPCSWLIEGCLPLTATRLGKADLFEILLDSGQLAENGMLFSIDSMEP